MMGTGKSTIGRELALRLDRPFVDLDSAIELRTKRSIKEIFATDGETRFRSLETDEWQRQSRRTDGVVLALGGGTLLEPQVREVAQTRGLAICLQADLCTLEHRLAMSENRPLLQDAPSRERLQEIMSARADAYAEFGIQLSTSGRSIEDVVDLICALLLQVEAA